MSTQPSLGASPRDRPHDAPLSRVAWSPLSSDFSNDNGVAGSTARHSLVLPDHNFGLCHVQSHSLHGGVIKVNRSLDADGGSLSKDFREAAEQVCVEVVEEQITNFSRGFTSFHGIGNAINSRAFGNSREGHRHDPSAS